MTRLELDAIKSGRLLGTSGQQSRRRDIASAAGSDAIGNDRLICRDVVRGDVLDGDLLLPSASVVIEPFGKHHDGAGGLKEDEISDPVKLSRVVQKSLDTALGLPDVPWHDWDEWGKGLT